MISLYYYLRMVSRLRDVCMLVDNEVKKDLLIEVVELEGHVIYHMKTVLSILWLLLCFFYDSSVMDVFILNL